MSVIKNLFQVYDVAMVNYCLVFKGEQLSSIWISFEYPEWEIEKEYKPLRVAEWYSNTKHYFSIWRGSL